MEKIYERVLELLGKSQDDPLFAKFINDLEENPHTLCKDNHGTTYLFRKSGLSLIFYEHSKCFATVFFHFGSEMANSGTVSRYSENLPAGIKFGDSRADVERKLGITPVFSKWIQGATAETQKNLWEEYEVEPLVFRFIFNGISNKLDSASVNYGPADIPPKFV